MMWMVFVLGAVLSGVFIGELLETPYQFEWTPVIIATIVTAVLTILAGWIASAGILGRKPLDILRQIES